MSHNSNNRKRSRWGDRPPNDAGGSNTGGAAAATASVSDQEALEALLASAKSKEETQQQQRKAPPNDYHGKKPRREGEGGRGGGGRGDDRSGRGGGGRGDHRNKDNNGPDYSYYGNNKDNGEEGTAKKSAEGDKEDSDGETKDKEKPNFGLSGALAQEEVGELKFREPPEARAPNTQWRFYVFKNDEAIETLHISKQSAYLFGRNKELADIPLLHPSASGQHAVLQYRALPGKEDGRLRCKPYLMDLESTNGSFINGVQIDPARYYELKKGDVLKFGASTREYVLLTENTTAIK